MATEQDVQHRNYYRRNDNQNNNKKSNPPPKKKLNPTSQNGHSQKSTNSKSRREPGHD